MNKKYKIAVIGLGYVGLPLATLFASKYSVIGFDINQKRVEELKNGNDGTLEVSTEELQKVHKIDNLDSNGLFFTSDASDLQTANVYIVTVPTPVDKNNSPDLTPLKKASETIGKVLKKGDIVIYESTVYPGVTEEECAPVLENVSGLKFNVDFFAGYSPERVNPGDKEKTIDKIKKVTSGSTPEIAQEIDQLYQNIITAGTHLASSIKVAEAAKVIENAQRDINIAFVNELAKIFALMNIDTKEVLAAAGTKWNFMPFKPGLVGGHCIGVDPFYLAQKAQEIGYYSELILSARRLNDSMGSFVAAQVIKLMIQNDLKIKDAKILVMGVTFKENCPDMRNSKVWDVVNRLTDYGCELNVYDPWVDWNKRRVPEGIQVATHLELNTYDAVVLAVAHDQFLDASIRSFLKPHGVIYDVKGVLNEPVEGSL
ncbi:nucleotide sugar dehydrogenase [Flavobacterium sp. xlx-214]|uniref:nucleotide sugar dehydrogenase n=1 Tax=unclassified Flavobacterium TaxID=196869 RepID=UPI0013D749FA|nr:MULTISPECIES: nucleotide sugar dehydrogenase [unclassified Flavobacterium]MBA5793678.1 nucleotide sugar dehydrogenase [Flavobacterium sp. xlx-221]QMI83297.1 nucleotide sugar dehydrogenase [Flavobacterium sp. xlx-214]